MPRKVIHGDSYVFDALVLDKYHQGGTNAQERRRKLELVYKAMYNELTQKQLDMLKDYYINGNKMKDIAEESGVHPSTVTRQIKRAKAKIIHITQYF